MWMWLLLCASEASPLQQPPHDMIALRLASTSMSKKVVLLPQLYVVGGLGVGGPCLNSTERFDPVAGIWQTLAPMSAARCRHSASTIGGQLYIIGGYGVGDQPLNSTECFDPVAGIWPTLASMSVERSAYSSSVIIGQLYCVGRLANLGTHVSGLSFFFF